MIAGEREMTVHGRGDALGPGSSARAALQLLYMCPRLPTDAFRHLAGFASLGGAYRRLQTLRQAGLADAERTELGYLVADRPLGLWSVTENGLRLLHVACADQRVQRSGGRPGRFRTNAALRVASYRLLAYATAELNADAHTADLRSCEQPWVRNACGDHGRQLRVELPAGAVLGRREAEGGRATCSSEWISLILIPDLCAAPVEYYRQRLRRLFLYRQLSGEYEWQLLVATDDARVGPWMSLLDKVSSMVDGAAQTSRVVSWEHVRGVLGDAVQQHAVELKLRASADQGHLPRAKYGPRRLREQVLHLVGRHPYLSVDQLARLLGTTIIRIRRAEEELVDSGLLRRIEADELPANAINPTPESAARLGLVECTLTGRRQLATWVGLDAATAARYHGLIGTGQADAGRRRRLLRTLAHTLGANAVFVALAEASAAVRRAGGSDLLREWRAAAACERKYCKPDGYGCYVRDGHAHGFFLEYDRGTEPTWKYRAKFRAYARYRDSGDAGREYAGFPAVLFVTTQPTAEWRIAEAAEAEWCNRSTEPLVVLLTSTDRIRHHPEGILGPIWRTTTPRRPGTKPERRYWLTAGPPGGRFVMLRQAAPSMDNLD